MTGPGAGGPQAAAPPPGARPDQVIATSGPGGAIYDIGYRGYAGPRLGRASAVRSLAVLTVRGAFGIGRGARSKIVPFGLLVLLLIPALISLGLTALAGSAAERFNPVTYETYYSITQTVLFLFIAAQAPELVGPDQRDRVLPLYFSRPILRDDYAFAKLIALVGALLLFTLAPQALLLFGRILQVPDLGDGIAKNLPSLLPILGSALFISVLFAAIGLAISSLTPRRAYATVAIIGVFIASNAITGILFAVLRNERDLQRWTALLSIDTILAGVTSFLFQTQDSEMANPIVRRADLPGWLYVVAALVLSSVAVAVVFRRYRTVET